MRVVEFKATTQPDAELWQKRLALQIAAQLPDNASDALVVLGLTKTLVEAFLAQQGLS